MTKESEYIIRTLKLWCEQFDGIHVRYAYDAKSEYHIVEVDPESVRRGNDLYKKAELAFWSAFMSDFPESDLLICEPTRSNDMANCLFESPHQAQDNTIRETFWAEACLEFEDVSTLSMKSFYSKHNEYNTVDVYSLAA